MKRIPKYTSGGAKNPNYTKLKNEYDKVKKTEDKKYKKPIKYSSYLADKLRYTSKYTSEGAIHPKYTKLKNEYEKAKNLEERAKARKKN